MSEIVYIRTAGAIVSLFAMGFVLHRYMCQTSVQQFLYEHKIFVYFTGLDINLSVLVVRARTAGANVSPRYSTRATENMTAELSFPIL